MRVVVTGANGFVGAPTCGALAAAGVEVVAAVRGGARVAPGLLSRPAPDLGAGADWGAVLDGAGAVVHLAARVHVMRERDSDPLASFRAVNVAGTLALAGQAAAAGVGHLVFLSSIKACGEETFGRPFDPTVSAPLDPYGLSKLEAEHGLARLAARTGLAVTVLRPPLVHGPGVKGNLRALAGWLARGLPLPLGAVDNRRALIGVDNLAAAIVRALERPPAPGCLRTYTLCDAETVSTPELARRLGRALGRPARLTPVPVGLLWLAGRLTGRSAAVARLTGSLEVDDRLIRAELAWAPPVGLDDGLAALAAAYPISR